MTNDIHLGLTVQTQTFDIFEKGIEFFLPIMVSTRVNFILKGPGAASFFEEVIDFSLFVARSRFQSILGFLVVESLETLKVSLLDSRQAGFAVLAAHFF